MLPNLPILHWWRNKKKKNMRNCWDIPNLLELQFNNKYWQVKETKNGTFYLYAAYYDVRKAQRPPCFDGVQVLCLENILMNLKVNSSEPELRPGAHGPSVRILGMIDRWKPNVTTHCKLWFDNNGPPVLSNVTGPDRNKV